VQKINLILGKAFLWSLAVCSLGACGNHDRFTVGGVSDKFCVPKELVPPSVWYVPDDPPSMPKGFAFMGCGYVDSTIDTCGLPDGLISASVHPLSVHVNHRWGELAGAVLFSEVFNAPGRKYEWVDKKEGVFLLKSQSSFIPWTIWKRMDGTPDASPLTLQDSDELMADCAPTYTQHKVDGTTQDLDSISCRRSVIGPAYTIEYEFKRRKGLPSEEWMRGFDAALFAKVDSWRCH